MKLVLRSFLVGVCLASLAAQAQQPDWWPGLKAWRFGQDRKPLEAVERAVTASFGRPAEQLALARDLAGILTSDSAYDARQFVCRQLALIGTDQQVPVLAALVTANEEPMAQMALYALARIPGTAADDALRTALDRTSGRTRLGVIGAVAGRQDRKSVPQLQRFLSADDDTAAASAAALGRIGGAAAVQALEGRYVAASAMLRDTITDALLACAESALKDGDRKAAGAICRRLYETRGTPWMQAAALKGLVSAEGEKAAPWLLESLRDEGSPRQRVAAELIRQVPGEKLTREVAALLPRIPSGTQVLLVGALAARGDRAALPAVTALCAASDAAVRRASLEALGELGNPSSVATLASHAAQGPSGERDVARASLVRLRGRGLNAAMRDQMVRSTGAAQVELLRALGERGATEAVTAILKLVANPDGTIRLAAWRALRELGRSQDLAALIDLLVQAPSSDRDEAETTVVTVARLGSDEAHRTGALLARLPGIQDPENRSSLFRVLGQVGGPEALAALRQALSDGQPDVRLTVIRLLSEWPAEEPLSDLLAVVRKPRDNRERAVALRGFIRLIGLNENRGTADALGLYREAMTLATSAAEKRLVLSGLAGLKSLATLEIAAEQLKNPELRREAEAAVLQIGRATAGAWREQTRAALRQVSEGTDSDAVRKQAGDIAALIEKFGNFVTAWEVSPAYFKTDNMAQWLFDAPFPPEIPDQAKSVNWRLLPAGVDPQQPWVMDLLAVHGGEQKVAYARTVVSSDTAQELTLELGSDDGIKVWLNGTVVHANNAVRGIAPAQDKPKVSLKAGRNDLMVKVTQNVMGWALCARFVKPDGSPATGLNYEIP